MEVSMNRFLLFAVISGILCFLISAAPLAWSENDPGRVFYGNVYGTIQSAANFPIAGVRVYISDSPVRTASGNHQDAVQSNIGCVILPDPDRAVRSGRSTSDGTYLVNNIPIHGDVQRYTVVIRPENAAPVVVNQVPILPGAAMALQIDVTVTDTDTAHVVSGLETSQTVITNNYRHRLRAVAPPPPMPPADERVTGVRPNEAYTLTIYATREGLVGATTANGHVIKERDHFVALPSTRVLCSKGGYEYQVRLEHNGYTETAPVWDIGPWNIHDNYWDPEQERQIYKHLSDGGQSGGLGRGLPEAQAAYQDDFNNGYDEYGRKVVNPAGIDLADGTFWDALQMNDNAWIEVSYRWIADDGDSGSITCFVETLME